jgi:hypothetical protein
VCVAAGVRVSFPLAEASHCNIRLAIFGTREMAPNLDGYWRALGGLQLPAARVSCARRKQGRGALRSERTLGGSF